MKEAIEHFVTFAAPAERTLPGIYRWPPQPEVSGQAAVR
jgi:hypothetical protein